jgi:Icc-related predicted phosphoesterase
VGADDRLIIVSHYPADMPDSPNWPGGAGGYMAIGELIVATHPIVVIQGHVHEWFGVVRETQVDGHRCLAIHPGPAGMLVQVETGIGRARAKGGA